MDETENASDNIFSLSATLRYLKALRRNLKLLPLFVVGFWVLAVLFYLLAPTRYEATAVIGPQQNSPTSNFYPGGGTSVSSSVSRKLLGSSGSGSDNFEEYQQTLTSVRLAKTLIEKDHILQILYPNAWDAKTKSWKQPGPVHGFLRKVKSAITGKPPHNGPDLDRLHMLLKKRLVVAKYVSGKASKTPSFFNRSVFRTVTFDWRNREVAQQVLEIILREADNIIREDLKHDVEQRLAFLSREASDVTMSSQREAIIAVMTGQEQLRMMAEADSRFASELVDPPYTPQRPVSHELVWFLLLFTLLGIIVWLGYVYLKKTENSLARSWHDIKVHWRQI